MTSIMKRKPSMSFADIGIWKGIFEFLSLFAIMVNVAIIALSS